MSRNLVSEKYYWVKHVSLLNFQFLHSAIGGENCFMISRSPREGSPINSLPFLVLDKERFSSGFRSTSIHQNISLANSIFVAAFHIPVCQSKSWYLHQGTVQVSTMQIVKRSVIFVSNLTEMLDLRYISLCQEIRKCVQLCSNCTSAEKSSETTANTFPVRCL